MVTRYPITGYGSVYPSYIYLKSTNKTEVRYELNENWERTGNICYEFPISSETYYNSMAPNVTHLARLGADFDGDMCDLICLLTEEAKDEINAVLNSKNYYVSVDGQMAFSASNDIIDLVVANMTS
jgi:hypothetical protein